MQAEWLFVGGPIYPGRGNWRPVEALAVGGGRVLALGARHQVAHLVGPRTRTYDLAGRPLIPSLTDAHLHLVAYAQSLAILPVGELPSLAAVLAKVADRAAELRLAAADSPELPWVVGRGWDQDRWAERRMPTRHDLDQLVPDLPVVLYRNCTHLAVLNTAALRATGIGPETPDPDGGQIDREASGHPTGLLREKALELVNRAIPPLPALRLRELMGQAIREALSYGITGIHTDDVDRYAGGFDPAESLYRAWIGPDGLPFRVTQMIPIALLAEAEARGIRTGAGDEWYRYGQVKLFADGSLGGRTALLRAPYADDPTTLGLAIYNKEDFVESVSRAHRLGNQVGCHCIGDAAAELFLDAVAAAQASNGDRTRRHRLIHAQILGPDLIERMAALGVVGDIQPVFLKSDGYWYTDRVGPDRARYSYAWRSLLTAGIPLCGGSDCPIEPLNPWYGIYAAALRQDLDGYPEGGWAPEQRLTVGEALDLYTSGAAWATFQEGFTGHLAPGMAADLVVLNRDPFTVDPTALKEIKADLTMAGGRVGWEA
jgi:predicted amidohydrolase YtcJ